MNAGRRHAALPILLGAAVAGSPMAGACDTEQAQARRQAEYDAWAGGDAASGRINMHDVRQAFRDSPDTAAFERRVNEIYEGDWLVLVRASVDQDRVFLEGWEDLNGSGEIEDRDRRPALRDIQGERRGVPHRRPPRQLPLRGGDGSWATSSRPTPSSRR